MTLQLWEILVPTLKPDNFPGKKRFFTTKYHRQWDTKVIKIANGITILDKAKGRWVSSKGELFKESMIPVRIACTKEHLEVIMKITASHYKQLAVMAYKISDDVIIKDYQ